MSKVGRRLYTIGSQLHDTWKLVSSLVDAHNAHVTETHERLPHRGQVDSQGMTLLRISDRLERIEGGLLRLDQKLGLIDQSLEEMNLRQEREQGTEGGSGLSLGDEVEPGSPMWDRLTPDERDVIANRIVLGLRAMAGEEMAREEEAGERVVGDTMVGQLRGEAEAFAHDATQLDLAGRAPVDDEFAGRPGFAGLTAKRTVACQVSHDGAEKWVEEGESLWQQGRDVGYVEGYKAGEKAGAEREQGVTWSGGRQGQGMGKGQAGTGTEAER